VFEASERPGGKLTSITTGDFRFDAGPSLFTLPDVLDDVFHCCGKNPRDYYQYHRKSRICEYFFSDGTRFSASADMTSFAEEAEKVFGVPAKNTMHYLHKSRKKYQATAPIFLQKSLHKAKTYFSREVFSALKALPQLGLLSTLHEENSRTLVDERLIQLFDRYATYNGSSPFKTPGIMSMIPHLEMGIGTFFPKGGMIRITQALEQLALDLGVQFHFNSRVTSIQHKQKHIKGISINDRFVPADLVVCNMDVVAAYRQLLPEVKLSAKVARAERSSSGIIFYWGIRGTFPQLDLHNIFFSGNYRDEFEAIFKRKTISTDPTIYLNISSKEQPDDAPEGCENWFVMINAPTNEGQNWDHLIQLAKENILKKLSHHLNCEISNQIICEQVLDPRTIESRTSSLGGSLYGTASNSKMAAFLRHPNFSSIKGLYFCGGSVHPGGGIPLCLYSAQIVSETISKDFR
jgi:phytoene desaturase